MAIDPKRTEKQKKQDQECSARRGFLKKAAYSAPALIALGQLVHPTQSKGESNIPDPPW